MKVINDNIGWPYNAVGAYATDDIVLFENNTGRIISPDILPPNPRLLPIDPDKDHEPIKFPVTFYYGEIKDKETGEPIPGATIEFIGSDGKLIYRKMSDANGYFEFSTEIQPETIVITATEFNGMKFPASSDQHLFNLVRIKKELEPVLVTSGKKNYLWIALLGLFIIAASSKKKIGKIDQKSILTIGLAVLMIFGFSTLKKFFEGLGIFQSKEGKEFDQEISDPGSFWNPGFWQKGGSGTLILTDAACEWLYNEIYNSFSIWGDDEKRIFSAFKTIKTQSQLSYFSYWLMQKKNIDLLKWLKGSDWGPVGDHLSVDEISVITTYIKQLPKYKV